MKDLLKKLQEDGSVGLDLSPGNDLSWKAADCIQKLSGLIEPVKLLLDEWNLGKNPSIETIYKLQEALNNVKNW